MCLAQRPHRSEADEARIRGHSVSSQALYHWAAGLPADHEILNMLRCDRPWNFELMRQRVNESPTSFFPRKWGNNTGHNTSIATRNIFDNNHLQQLDAASIEMGHIISLVYSKCSKTSYSFHFLFSNEMLF